MGAIIYTNSEGYISISTPAQQPGIGPALRLAQQEYEAASERLSRYYKAAGQLAARYDLEDYDGQVAYDKAVAGLQKAWNYTRLYLQATEAQEGLLHALAQEMATVGDDSSQALKQAFSQWAALSD